jgi:hypothetical protein
MRAAITRYLAAITVLPINIDMVANRLSLGTFAQNIVIENGIDVTQFLQCTMENARRTSVLHVTRVHLTK